MKIYGKMNQGFKIFNTFVEIIKMKQICIIKIDHQRSETSTTKSRVCIMKIVLSDTLSHFNDVQKLLYFFKQTKCYKK